MNKFRIVALVGDADLGAVMAAILSRGAVIACELVTPIAEVMRSEPKPRPSPKAKRTGTNKPNDTLINAIMGLFYGSATFSRRHIVANLADRGYRRNQIDGMLSKMVMKGDLTRPSPGNYQLPQKPGAVTPVASEAELALIAGRAPVKVVL